MPITWRNRRTGVAKLKIKEMGSRYLFIVLYVLAGEVLQPRRLSPRASRRRGAGIRPSMLQCKSYRAAE